MKAPFETEKRRSDILHQIQAISGVNLNHADVSKYPGFSLSDLDEGDRVEQFLNIFDWVVGEIRAHYSEPTTE
jgi:hypothetical protein